MMALRPQPAPWRETSPDSPGAEGLPGPKGNLRTPRVSVVIPTYRRPELLGRCLEAVIGQDLAPDAFEVIVVDDGHDEATRALLDGLQRLPGVPTLRYLRPEHGRGPAVARNCGWRAGRGALIAFTDDDTVPEPDWLRCGEQAMRKGFVALGGRVKVPVEDPPTDHELMTRGLERAEFVTANAFVRRAALERIDGFDERFTRAWREDSDLQFRLAELGPVGRCAEASVLHPVRPERWGVCLRQQRNAFFEALLYKKHPRLYRERIRLDPPWNYYGIVLLTIASVVALALQAWAVAAGAALLAVLGIGLVAGRRLRATRRTPAHVLEMLLTSALIPFLSVYWRLRGAVHFRVLFL